MILKINFTSAVSAAVCSADADANQVIDVPDYTSHLSTQSMWHRPLLHSPRN